MRITKTRKSENAKKAGRKNSLLLVASGNVKSARAADLIEPRQVLEQPPGRSCLANALRSRSRDVGTGQLAASEQGIDCVRDRCWLSVCSRQGQASDGHSSSADRRDVVAAGLAVVVAVDLAAERVGQERAIDDQFLGL